MQNITNILDMAVIYGLMIMSCIFAYYKFLAPMLTTEIYKQIQSALMICGYAFKEEKIKKIIETATTVVAQMEKLDSTSQEKHEEAFVEIFNTLIEEADIVLDKSAIDLIIQIAVSHI